MEISKPKLKNQFTLSSSIFFYWHNMFSRWKYFSIYRTNYPDITYLQNQYSVHLRSFKASSIASKRDMWSSFSPTLSTALSSEMWAA